LESWLYDKSIDLSETVDHYVEIYVALLKLRMKDINSVSTYFAGFGGKNEEIIAIILPKALQLLLHVVHSIVFPRFHALHLVRQIKTPSQEQLEIPLGQSLRPGVQKSRGNAQK